MATLPLVEIGVQTLISPPGFRIFDPTPNASGPRYFVIKDESLVDYSVEVTPFIKQGIVANSWFKLDDAIPVFPTGQRVVINQVETGSASPIEYLFILTGYTRDRRFTVTIEKLF